MPTYSEMVFEAIKALKDRNGSSLAAIKKFMVTTHPELATKFAPHQLRAALKKGTESGKLIKVKSSYKLSAEAKKVVEEKVVKKTATKKADGTPKKKIVKKTVTKKAGGTPKKKVAKKSVTKKSPSKKTAPKPAA